MDVRTLLNGLLDRFPLEDAESWDKPGLTVGDPDDLVRGVAVALDPTPENIEAAHRTGANVLVTHHPLWISAPESLSPDPCLSGYAGRAAYTAARLGVSVLSFHTNLDRSLEARALLPQMMGLASAASLEHPDRPDLPGLGALCEPIEPIALAGLAGRAKAAFGGCPRVWGEADKKVGRVAVLGGSLGEFGVAASELGADVVIAGEAGYHVCQDVLERGTSLILLGHDRSEAPFTRILEQAVIGCGVDPADVHVFQTAYPLWTLSEGD